MDSDGDGIPNYIDKEPFSIPGSPVNRTGVAWPYHEKYAVKITSQPAEAQKYLVPLDYWEFLKLDALSDLWLIRYLRDGNHLVAQDNEVFMAKAGYYVAVIVHELNVAKRNFQIMGSLDQQFVLVDTTPKNTDYRINMFSINLEK